MVKVPVAITSYWSELSPVGVTVPVVVTVLTRGVTRLLVSVSVVARPTSVSVLVGSVRVPVLTMVLMTGADSVGPVPSTTEPDPVLVVTPVPPEPTARVPAKVIVPAPVTGPPEVVRPVVPPLTATLVTVPVAPFATLSVPVVIDRPVPRAMVPVVPPSDATVFAVVARVPVVGSVRLVAPVAVNVVLNAPDVARVLPLASVRTPVVLVIVKPLTLVAVAAPSVGVTKTGLVARTIEPEPVVAFPSAVTVPLVGSVRLVDADTVSVIGYAPLIVRVLAVLFATPVPPRLGAITVPFHVALVIEPA